jgi:hypothetical protein
MTCCTRTASNTLRLVICLAGPLAIAAGAASAAEWRPPREPKPLSENVSKGLAWLVARQLPSGGWGQGEESAQMGGGGELKDTATVADTCTAILALVRAGHTPKSGDYAASVSLAVTFVLAEIEKSDEESLSITGTQGTRVQAKLGPFIDTFLASVVLPEVEGTMPDDAGEARLRAGIEKVVRKIERNQRDDGTWDDRGWAPALAQSMAAKGLNRAFQRGFDVDGDVLVLAEDQARDRIAPTGGGGFGGGGDAGVALYAGASNLGALQESIISNQKKLEELKEAAKSAPTEAERSQAREQIVSIERAEAEFNEFQKQVVDRLDDEQFIAGFGSNGGEEFLSYLNIGESLVIKGDEEWSRWDADITANLNRVQNEDGSWTGHHCITGRTFCTATALLVLMTDRMPVSVDAAGAKGPDAPDDGE